MIEDMKDHIKTERLTLRPMTTDDAAFVLRMINSEEYKANIGDRKIHTIESVIPYIQEKMVDHYQKYGYGNYRIERIADQVEIGCVSLYNRPDIEGVDIGFALLSPYFKQGYAYEAASALIQHGREVHGLSHICAFTLEENISSRRLIEKLGLRFRKTILFGEKEEELLYYDDQSG